MIEGTTLEPVGQVLLMHPTSWIVMRVEVGTVFLRPGTMTVAQVVGHLAARTVTDLGQRGIDRCLGGVALGCQAHVDDRLGQIDAALGIADDLRGLEGRLCDQESLRVGVANVNLSKLKNGKVSAIRFSTLEAICDVLDCQPGDILEYQREENQL